MEDDITLSKFYFSILFQDHGFHKYWLNVTDIYI